MKNDHYKVLEVARDASAEDLQHAYRALALRYHPDRNAAPEASARMAAINEAWETLGDPRRRRQYDALLAKPPLHPEFTASILLAAREVILRSGWRIVEDSGKALLLENGRQKVRVVFRERIDAAGLQWIAKQFPEFCVVLSVSVEGPIYAGMSAAAIDLVHSERHGAPLPEGSQAPGRSLFAAFL
jgi:curved DNA-binding protein CbpA